MVITPQKVISLKSFKEMFLSEKEILSEIQSVKVSSREDTYPNGQNHHPRGWAIWYYRECQGRQAGRVTKSQQYQFMYEN